MAPHAAPARLSKPEVVIAGLERPQELKLFNGWLFWIDHGDTARGSRICKMLTSGGDVTVLASGLEAPVDLAVDAERVYFATLGSSTVPVVGRSVSAVPISGGPVTVLATPAGVPTSVAIDRDFVYFSTRVGQENGAISRVPKRGGAVKVIVSGQSSPDELKVDNNGLLWFEAGGWASGPVLHEHKITGEPLLVVKVAPRSVEERPSPLDRLWPRVSDVLVSSRGWVVSLARGGNGLARPLQLDGVRLFAVEAGELFAIKESGLVVRFNESTATEEPLGRVPYPGGLAVDGTFLYVTDMEGGRILCIPRVSTAGSDSSP